MTANPDLGHTTIIPPLARSSLFLCSQSNLQTIHTSCRGRYRTSSRGVLRQIIVRKVRTKILAMPPLNKPRPHNCHETRPTARKHGEVSGTRHFIRFCSKMHIQGFLARRGVLELAIQSILYGSLYVVFAEGVQ